MNFITEILKHKLAFNPRCSLLFKQAILVLWICLGIGILSSCNEDELSLDGQDEIFGEDSGESIVFYLDAGTGFNTRYEQQSDAEKNEDVINSLRVLFFNQDGKFLIEGPITSRTQITESSGRKLQKITVQFGSLKDGSGKSIGSAIREQLTKENFKVAILANWPNPNRPNWNYYHSYLNPFNQGDNPAHLKTLNDLHFNNKTDDNHKKNFSYLVKNDSISDNRNWVQQRDLSKEYNVNKTGHKLPDNSFKLTSDTTDKWLRTFWDPEQDKKYMDSPETQKPVFRLYKGLWKLWNFGGSFENNKLTYSQFGSGADSWTSEWKTRNADEFAKARHNGGTGKWLGSYGNTWITAQTTLDGLTIVPTAETEESDEDKIIRSLNRFNYHGIILPKVENLATNGTKTYVGENTKGYIKFTQETSGHLNIYYSAFGGQEQDAGEDVSNPSLAKIRIMRGQNDLDNGSGILTTNIIPKQSSTKVTDDIAVNSIEIKITGDPEDIYIFTDESSDNSSVIYAIEFVSDIYLYETNREGVSSANQDIPMFGVQEYEAFGTWVNGETKDLLSLGGTPVAIIRSVAKVEVNLPKPNAQVFMRCMNRKGDCETVDVNTSTSESWVDAQYHTTTCEWNTIKGYKVWIDNGSKSDYENWYKWYFGSWKDWKGWTGVPDEGSNGKYPRIFNPHIERSDFTEFIYVGYVNGYYKYILYVPEKGIADPNVSGYFNSPKVAHIEYRYETVTNSLDDNECYRIYFTDYKTNDAIKNQTKDSYETYEANTENLKNHWPIMRNHKYVFNVSESSTTLVGQTINAQIAPWGYTPDESWEETW